MNQVRIWNKRKETNQPLKRTKINNTKRLYSDKYNKETSEIMVRNYL